jgi:hypothetical protein
LLASYLVGPLRNERRRRAAHESTQPFIAKQPMSILGTLRPTLPVILLEKQTEIDGWAFLPALEDWRQAIRLRVDLPSLNIGSTRTTFATDARLPLSARRSDQLPTVSRTWSGVVQFREEARTAYCNDIQLSVRSGGRVGSPYSR